ncbi:MAG TPA: metallophosphoesterase [Firmicutes bacterium]|nr:metallophosphoesterase [Bacillota bacterium]
MKILALADREEALLYEHYSEKRFGGVDLILSCGDLAPEYLSFLTTMINVPLFYVRGNHDLIYNVKKPEGCINIDGRIVTYKGLRIMGFEGSKPYTNEAVQYTEWDMRLKVLKVLPRLMINRKVDIIVTHAPPLEIHDMSDVCHRGFQVFRWLIKSYKPRYFLHGHVHLNYTSDRSRVTTIDGTHVINCDGFYLFDYEKGPGNGRTLNGGPS